MPQFAARISALESHAAYPLGDDFFKIDHGKDYFAFFERLGELAYYAAVDNNSVMGVGAGVLRRIPDKNGSPMRAWYLCDLKVSQEHKGKHIPLKILKHAFPFNYMRCRRGYAISMNPAQGENRVVKLLQRFSWAKLHSAGMLYIYSLTQGQVNQLRHIIETHCGPISFLSIQDKKGIILQSTQQQIPLLHIQHGLCAEQGVQQPIAGCAHMLCAHENSGLFKALTGSGIVPSASATLIQHGLKDANWSFVLTSDI